jgi:hypothetical protein
MPADPRQPDETAEHEDRDEQSRIEREARRRRGSSLAGALAARDGGDHLKGASPTPLIHRAALNLSHWLDANLEDAEGALRRVIVRAVGEHPDLLAQHADDPAGAMASWLPALLAQPPLLAELVRQADVEWGRLYAERPYFERDGSPAHPDDPYTRQDVHRRLTALLALTRR